MTNSVDPFAGLRLWVEKYGPPSHARTLAKLDAAIERVRSNSRHPAGKGSSKNFRADIDALAEQIDELEGRLLINMGRMDEFHQFADNLAEALHKEGVGASGGQEKVDATATDCSEPSDCIDDPILKQSLSEFIDFFLNSGCLAQLHRGLVVTVDDRNSRVWSQIKADRSFSPLSIPPNAKKVHRTASGEFLMQEPVQGQCDHGTNHECVDRGSDKCFAHCFSPSVCPHCHGVIAGAHSPASAKHTEGETPKAGDSRG